MWHVSWLGSFLICLSLCKFHIAILHLSVMCFLNDKLLSIHAPKCLIVSNLVIFSLLMLICLVWHFCSCCLDPIKMNSVLSLFILSLLWSIQFFTLIQQSCNWCIVLSSSLHLVARKSFFYYMIIGKTMEVYWSGNFYP